MTRQLDPTILRFFTVSRIISPASEMCLCKFHIKIEYFLTHRHHRARRRCLRFGSSPGIPQSPTKLKQIHPILHFPPPSYTTLHNRFQKPAFHGLAYLRPHFPRFRDTPEKTPKNSFVPYVPNPILLCVFHYGEVVPEPSSAIQFPLFPIFFFLFTYMSMFCPIF